MRIFLFTWILFFSAAALGQSPEVYVRLLSGKRSVTVTSSVEMLVHSSEGRRLTALPPGQEHQLRSVSPQGFVVVGRCELYTPYPSILISAPGGLLTVKDVSMRTGLRRSRERDRSYKGVLEIRRCSEGGLDVVSVVSLEDYLRSVVPSEIGPAAPGEALRAQAVAARSNAYYSLMKKSPQSKREELRPDVFGQVYCGVLSETARTNAAVRATRGEVLFFEDRPAEAFFHACCGGHTEEASNIWNENARLCSRSTFDAPRPLSYRLDKSRDFARWISSSPKVFCNPQRSDLPSYAAAKFRWQRKILPEVQPAGLGGLGRLIAIRPLIRTKAGRVKELEVTGEKGRRVVRKELSIRKLFRPPLPSSAFRVETEGDPRHPEAFIFQGAGCGHGVGLCQSGAIGMSLSGRDYKEILHHYYPRASLQKVY